jgi:hypothetical protein
MLHKDYKRECSVENKNTGHESPWACGQEELIGGKPLVVNNSYFRNIHTPSDGEGG